ncbi:hypothetical protein PG984_006875 [Apiospora sp. TS-2023a]
MRACSFKWSIQHVTDSKTSAVTGSVFSVPRDGNQQVLLAMDVATVITGTCAVSEGHPEETSLFSRQGNKPKCIGMYVGG